jgi:acyl-CoA reductase-like NAD-dependent aldehyde dehydrogenase
VLYVDGEWREAASGRTFEVTDPATGRVIGEVADGGATDTAAAIDAAAAALHGWAALTAYQRSETLYAAWQLMQERREDLAKLMTSEQGKPLRAARNEVGYAADFLLWFAEEAKRVYGQTISSPRADQRFLVLHQPVGVCSAITPWNYPVSMLTRKLGPALAAGCTIVLKPAEQTPLCAVEVFKIFDEVGLPPGVVNLLTGCRPRPHRRGTVAQSGGPQADLHRLDGGRQAADGAGEHHHEAGVDGAGRSRTLHRLRRRRPGAGGHRGGNGQGAQHGPGVHLPQPHLRAAGHRRSFRGGAGRPHR